MIKITINEATSYANLPALKELCRKHNWKLKELNMTYNPSKGLPLNEDVDHWPFKAIFEENDLLYEVSIFTLTVGYSGTGPDDFASILDFLEVPYEEDDIYTKRLRDADGFIRLHYIP